jgi:flavodoxin
VKTLVSYYSKFGHTRRIAESIAHEIQSTGTVRTIDSDQLTAFDFDGVDLVVMGSPTHRMNLPEALRPVLEALPKRVLRGKSVAVFDTSYKMSPILAYFTAAKRLSQRLRKLGGKQLVKPETFFVEKREGPLYEGELVRAGAWARMILERADHRPA